ncbi:Uncharacterised protein [Mycobacterium tuberculosis]|nr:Uncharacterised protein [Mycobacterium tuberculosis]CNN10596.1 Uncharacterised protein [Mycobacterium tuberculosis]CNN23263.1 Uncharacterised protein [Mycobacterium tuberculosis]CNN65777.1 Uncharacterised protein [Mycobacterium tuberculosis]CNN66740.1 Uncharacterised protein [Mycobacterium tuberculosis]
MRRLASPGVMCSRLANAVRSVPPSSSSQACPASWLIKACSAAPWRRRSTSSRCKQASNSGVVNASHLRSSTRDNEAW